jgi:hypothetical protein
MGDRAVVAVADAADDVPTPRAYGGTTGFANGDRFLVRMKGAPHGFSTSGATSPLNPKRVCLEALRSSAISPFFFYSC